MDEDIENKEAQFIDITNQMTFDLELLQDRYDLNAVRSIISNCCELLMSQGMTRDEAWSFVNNEWFA